MEKPYGVLLVSRSISRHNFVHIFLCEKFVLTLTEYHTYVVYTLSTLMLLFIPLNPLSNSCLLLIINNLFVTKLIINNLIQLLLFNVYSCVYSYSLLSLFTVAYTYRSLGLITWSLTTYPGSFLEKTHSPSLDSCYSLLIYSSLSKSET